MEECRVRHVDVFGRQLHPKGGVGGGRGGGFDVRTSRFDLLLSLGLVECFSRVSITFTNLFLKRIAFFKLISSLKPSLLKGPKDRGMTGMRATDMDGSYKSALGAKGESVLGALDKRHLDKELPAHGVTASGRNGLHFDRNLSHCRGYKPHVEARYVVGFDLVVMWCGVMWCGMVWCGVVWCGVVWCGVVWCGVVWCGVVW